MPDITATIDRHQRDGLYELVRNHLGSVGDLWHALEYDKDFAKAERLGLEFGEDFRLLGDIGWKEKDDRESFDLTMPPHDLMEVAGRSQGGWRSWRHPRPRHGDRVPGGRPGASAAAVDPRQL